MKMVTDTKLIENGRKVGRIASLAGLLILIAGLVVSFQQRTNIQPYLILFVYGSLLLGFILSNVGIYLANRWVREPRADQALAKVLKGFDNRYLLYNYVLPAQHVLLSPEGVAVIQAKRQVGTIRCDGDRWRHKLTVGRVLRFLTEEGLGNPSKEARHEAGAMQQFIAKRLPGEQVPVFPLVVFIGPKERLNLQVKSPSLPVLHLSDLKAEVRGLSDGEPQLASSTYQQLAQTFDAVAGA